MAQPTTLRRSISPPPARRRSNRWEESTQQDGSRDDSRRTKELETTAIPNAAAIEAGQAQIREHLDYFTQRFREVSHPAQSPGIRIEDFRALFKRNQHKHGRHFVVHQHDHPVAGVHYDLRLQFSSSSTVSFAIPYGLPGNPNSSRPNRMAIETRVHNLWNNLIESASHTTGSLLIWDTGEYEILDWKDEKHITTDDELSDVDERTDTNGQSHSERLAEAFQNKHIRLRLHGTRLPSGYTVSMRLPLANDRSGQPKPPGRKRRRVEISKDVKPRWPVSSDSETENGPSAADGDATQENENDAAEIASDDEQNTIRDNNAYTGATNTIGSIHQRNWFLSLNKRNSGFHKVRSGPDQGRWVGNCEPFFVRGRDYERSIVTGRNADEVMEDEGVEKFVGRKMWRPILE